MVLVLVVSVLTISYASSLKAYFQQHSQIQQLRGQIASSESDINRLESEKARWNDPAYVREQARARFGYLMPGQTSYVVVGEDGKPLAAQSTLSDPRTNTLGHADRLVDHRVAVGPAGRQPAGPDARATSRLKYLGGKHQ